MADQDKDRLTAEAWLLESILAQFINEQNKKGVSVPLDMALQVYSTLWRVHGMNTSAREHVEYLLFGAAQVRWDWSRRFRKEWPIMCRSLPEGKMIEDAIIVRRASPSASESHKHTAC